MLHPSKFSLLSGQNVCAASRAIRRFFGGVVSLVREDIPRTGHREPHSYIFIVSMMVELSFGRCQNVKTITSFRLRIFIPKKGRLGVAIRKDSKTNLEFSKKPECKVSVISICFYYINIKMFRLSMFIKLIEIYTRKIEIN